MEEYVCESCNREFNSDYYYDDFDGYTERENVFIRTNDIKKEYKIIVECPYCNHIKVLEKAKSLSDIMNLAYFY